MQYNGHGDVLIRSWNGIKWNQSRLEKMKNSETKDKKHVTFDEEVIAEHDKERGTRMVILEPDTPFLRSSIMSSDDEAEPPTLHLEPNPSVRRYSQTD